MNFTEFTLLQLQSKKTSRHAFAEGSYKNIKTQWECYFMFCEYFQINPIPTTVQVLCFYAQFLSRSFKSVNSIKNYLSGVKLLHLYLDDDYPKFDEFQLKLTLKGFKQVRSRLYT